MGRKKRYSFLSIFTLSVFAPPMKVVPNPTAEPVQHTVVVFYFLQILFFAINSDRILEIGQKGEGKGSRAEIQPEDTQRAIALHVEAHEADDGGVFLNFKLFE